MARQPFNQRLPDLSGVVVAIMVAEGFEQVEMTEPRKALENAGATTVLISPETDTVKAWYFTEWGDKFNVDVTLGQANPDEYDALLLPGGVMSPDKLRVIPAAVQFVRHFVDARKPIASICHGPWTLINAEAVQGLTLTSWPSLQADLENAGATWVNKPVVRDGLLVTSRKPDDIPFFNQAMIALFSERAP
jgi:protease I